MGTNYIVDGPDLTALADSIREKTNVTTGLQVSEMPSSIDGIPGVSPPPAGLLILPRTGLKI